MSLLRKYSLPTFLFVLILSASHVLVYRSAFASTTPVTRFGSPNDPVKAAEAYFQALRGFIDKKDLEEFNRNVKSLSPQEVKNIGEAIVKLPPGPRAYLATPGLIQQYVQSNDRTLRKRLGDFTGDERKNFAINALKVHAVKYFNTYAVFHASSEVPIRPEQAFREDRIVEGRKQLIAATRVDQLIAERPDGTRGFTALANDAILYDRFEHNPNVLLYDGRDSDAHKDKPQAKVVVLNQLSEESVRDGLIEKLMKNALKRGGTGEHALADIARPEMIVIPFSAGAHGMVVAVEFNHTTKEAKIRFINSLPGAGITNEEILRLANKGIPEGYKVTPSVMTRTTQMDGVYCGVHTVANAILAVEEKLDAIEKGTPNRFMDTISPKVTEKGKAEIDRLYSEFRGVAVDVDRAKTAEERAAASRRAGRSLDTDTRVAEEAARKKMEESLKMRAAAAEAATGADTKALKDLGRSLTEAAEGKGKVQTPSKPTSPIVPKKAKALSPPKPLPVAEFLDSDRRATWEFMLDKRERLADAVLKSEGTSAEDKTSAQTEKEAVQALRELRVGKHSAGEIALIERALDPALKLRANEKIPQSWFDVEKESRAADKASKGLLIKALEERQASIREKLGEVLNMELATPEALEKRAWLFEAYVAEKVAVESYLARARESGFEPTAVDRQIFERLQLGQPIYGEGHYGDGRMFEKFLSAESPERPDPKGLVVDSTLEEVRKALEVKAVYSESEKGRLTAALAERIGSVLGTNVSADNDKLKELARKLGEHFPPGSEGKSLLEVLARMDHDTFKKAIARGFAGSGATEGKVPSTALAIAEGLLKSGAVERVGEGAYRMGRAGMAEVIEKARPIVDPATGERKLADEARALNEMARRLGVNLEINILERYQPVVPGEKRIGTLDAVFDAVVRNPGESGIREIGPHVWGESLTQEQADRINRAGQQGSDLGLLNEHRLDVFRAALEARAAEMATGHGEPTEERLAEFKVALRPNMQRYYQGVERPAPHEIILSATTVPAEPSKFKEFIEKVKLLLVTPPKTAADASISGVREGLLELSQIQVAERGNGSELPKMSNVLAELMKMEPAELERALNPYISGQGDKRVLNIEQLMHHPGFAFQGEVPPRVPAVVEARVPEIRQDSDPKQRAKSAANARQRAENVYSKMGQLGYRLLEGESNERIKQLMELDRIQATRSRSLLALMAEAPPEELRVMLNRIKPGQELRAENMIDLVKAEAEKARDHLLEIGVQTASRGETQKQVLEVLKHLNAAGVQIHEVRQGVASPERYRLERNLWELAKIKYVVDGRPTNALAEMARMAAENPGRLQKALLPFIYANGELDVELLRRRADRALPEIPRDNIPAVAFERDRAEAQYRTHRLEGIRKYSGDGVSEKWRAIERDRANRKAIIALALDRLFEAGFSEVGPPGSPARKAAFKKYEKSGEWDKLASPSMSGWEMLASTRPAVIKAAAEGFVGLDGFLEEFKNRPVAMEDRFLDHQSVLRSEGVEALKSKLAQVWGVSREVFNDRTFNNALMELYHLRFEGEGGKDVRLLEHLAAMSDADLQKMRQRLGSNVGLSDFLVLAKESPSSILPGQKWTVLNKGSIGQLEQERKAADLKFEAAERSASLNEAQAQQFKEQAKRARAAAEFKKSARLDKAANEAFAVAKKARSKAAQEHRAELRRINRLIQANPGPIARSLPRWAPKAGRTVSATKEINALAAIEMRAASGQEKEILERAKRAVATPAAHERAHVVGKVLDKELFEARTPEAATASLEQVKARLTGPGGLGFSEAEFSLDAEKLRTLERVQFSGPPQETGLERLARMSPREFIALFKASELLGGAKEKSLGKKKRENNLELLVAALTSDPITLLKRESERIFNGIDASYAAKKRKQEEEIRQAQEKLRLKQEGLKGLEKELADLKAKGRYRVAKAFSRFRAWRGNEKSALMAQEDRALEEKIRELEARIKTQRGDIASAENAVKSAREKLVSIEREHQVKLAQAREQEAIRRRKAEIEDQRRRELAQKLEEERRLQAEVAEKQRRALEARRLAQGTASETERAVQEGGGTKERSLEEIRQIAQSNPSQLSSEERVQLEKARRLRAEKPPKKSASGGESGYDSASQSTALTEDKVEEKEGAKAKPKKAAPVKETSREIADSGSVGDEELKSSAKKKSRAKAKAPQGEGAAGGDDRSVPGSVGNDERASHFGEGEPNRNVERGAEGSVTSESSQEQERLQKEAQEAERAASEIRVSPTFEANRAAMLDRLKAIREHMGEAQGQRGAMELRGEMETIERALANMEKLSPQAEAYNEARDKKLSETEYRKKYPFRARLRSFARAAPGLRNLVSTPAISEAQLESMREVALAAEAERRTAAVEKLALFEAKVSQWESGLGIDKPAEAKLAAAESERVSSPSVEVGTDKALAEVRSGAMAHDGFSVPSEKGKTPGSIPESMINEGRDAVLKRGGGGVIAGATGRAAIASTEHVVQSVVELRERGISPAEEMFRVHDHFERAKNPPPKQSADEEKRTRDKQRVAVLSKDALHAAAPGAEVESMLRGKSVVILDQVHLAARKTPRPAGADPHWGDGFSQFKELTEKLLKAKPAPKRVLIPVDIAREGSVSGEHSVQKMVMIVEVGTDGKVHIAAHNPLDSEKSGDAKSASGDLSRGVEASYREVASAAMAAAAEGVNKAGREVASMRFEGGGTTSNEPFRVPRGEGQPSLELDRARLYGVERPGHLMQMAMVPLSGESGYPGPQKVGEKAKGPTVQSAVASLESMQLRAHDARTERQLAEMKAKSPAAIVASGDEATRAAGGDIAVVEAKKGPGLVRRMVTAILPGKAVAPSVSDAVRAAMWAEQTNKEVKRQEGQVPR